MTTYAPQDGSWPDVTATDIGYHYPTNEDSYHTGLPDWWQWKWFGTYGENAGDLDANGNTLLYDYTNGFCPINLQFTVNLGTQNFNVTNATCSYVILAGWPNYEAVLINDTNFNDAVWKPYDGTVYMNLGPTDGVYQVWFGLKENGPNQQPVWMGATVYLDRVPPQVFITSPISNNLTVATPDLQVQGCASKPLQSVTFDLNNALGAANGQLGYITGRYLDPNLMEFTTNYFQCVDVLLTNGLNTIAVHATDLAGNVTTTNLNLTLDYSSATNPVINLYWPQNNTVIVGNIFTFRGWVDDPAATVFAQIVDSNNDTNIVQGIVERDGKFWVQNLPLAAGTSTVTLMVTNSAFLPSETNILVVQSTLNMTINPITDNLWLPTVNVSGTISDPGDYKVWVNGTNATVIGNNWTAQNVPVPQGGGVAAFQVRAIPDTENGGNGTGGNGGGPVTFDNLGNPDPTPDNDLETGALPRLTKWVAVDSAKWSSDYGDEISEQTLEIDQTEGHYTRTNGGEYSDLFEAKSTGGGVEETILTVDELAPGGAISDESVLNSGTGYNDLGPGGQFSFPLEEACIFPKIRMTIGTGPPKHTWPC